MGYLKMKVAVGLREEGRSWEEVAKKLKVTPAEAVRLVAEGKRLRRDSRRG